MNIDFYDKLNLSEKMNKEKRVNKLFNTLYGLIKDSSIVEKQLFEVELKNTDNYKAHITAWQVNKHAVLKIRIATKALGSSNHVKFGVLPNFKPKSDIELSAVFETGAYGTVVINTDGEVYLYNLEYSGSDLIGTWVYAPYVPI